MQINFHYGPQSTEQADRSNGAKPEGAISASCASTQVSVDQAQISGTHVQVQALAAEALRSPEVREQRVQSLREAIRNGHFQPDPQRTAGALVAEMALGAFR